VTAIVSLRQLRMTAAEIAEVLSMPHSTVSAILVRVGLGRLGRIGLEQPVRYERSRPGERGCPTSCVSGSGQSVSEVDFERE
jgi:hypothetical protein